ncbi:MAG: glutamate synthase [Alkalispirochaetaceae bacterium]
MVNLNARGRDFLQLNALISAALERGEQVEVTHLSAMHNLAVGLCSPGVVELIGSPGFYVGGFSNHADIRIQGNAGWYAADNLVGGCVEIFGNAGCNAGAYMAGGSLIIHGNAGSRLAYAMKGGTILVDGCVGRWCAQMTLGGSVVITGDIAEGAGESMYRGKLFLNRRASAGSLGSNVCLTPLEPGEREWLEELFETHNVRSAASSFQVVRPLTTGRHNYVLFDPDLTSQGPKRSQSAEASPKKGAII